MEEKKNQAPKGKYGKFEDYEVESAMRTMMEAEAIKKKPDMMKAVHKCMMDKMKEMKTVMPKITSMKDMDDRMTELDEEEKEVKGKK